MFYVIRRYSVLEIFDYTVYMYLLMNDLLHNFWPFERLFSWKIFRILRRIRSRRIFINPIRSNAIFQQYEWKRFDFN